MRNPMVALYWWFGATEKRNTHISSEKSPNSSSIFVELVGEQHDSITLLIPSLGKEKCVLSSDFV